MLRANRTKQDSQFHNTDQEDIIWKWKFLCCARILRAVCPSVAMRNSCCRLRKRAQPAQVAAAMHCPAVTKSKNRGVRVSASRKHPLAPTVGQRDFESKSMRPNAHHQKSMNGCIAMHAYKNIVTKPELREGIISPAHVLVCPLHFRPLPSRCMH